MKIMQKYSFDLNIMKSLEVLITKNEFPHSHAQTPSGLARAAVADAQPGTRAADDRPAVAGRLPVFRGPDPGRDQPPDQRHVRAPCVCVLARAAWRFGWEREGKWDSVQQPNTHQTHYRAMIFNMLKPKDECCM